MFYRLLFRSVTFLLLMATLSVGQDNPFEQLFPDAAPELPKRLAEAKGQAKPDESAERNPEEDAKDREAKADAELLDALEDELNAMIEGKDKLSVAVRKLQDKFRKEFQANERELVTASQSMRSKIEVRQRTLAQYHIELDLRKNDRRNGIGDVSTQVHRRLREFQRQHPRVGRTDAFRTMQREMPRKAMMNRRRVGYGSPPTIGETMAKLSSGEVEIPEERRRWSRVHPAEEDGPIPHRSSQLQALMQISWDGERLKLDRAHWDVPFAGQSLADVRLEVTHLLEAEGVKAEPNNAQQQILLRQRQLGNASESNVARLFGELRGSQNSSRSARSSGKTATMSFEDGVMNARMKVSPTEFDLRILESVHPDRMLWLRENQKGLSLTLVGGRVIHRFHQDGTTGAVVVSEILDGEIQQFEAANFAKLYASEPRFVDDHFFALLDHVGVVAPLCRFDDMVVRQLLDDLAKDADEINNRVNTLVASLDSPRFAVRETAYEELEKGIEEFYTPLYSRKFDDSLSREVRARIRKLIEVGDENGAVYAGSLVSSMNLTKDSNYLDQVRDLVDEAGRKLIDEQLKRNLLE